MVKKLLSFAGVAVQVAALGLVSYGISAWSVPAALIVAGVVVIAAVERQAGG